MLEMALAHPGDSLHMQGEPILLLQIVLEVCCGSAYEGDKSWKIFFKFLWSFSLILKFMLKTLVRKKGFHCLLVFHTSSDYCRTQFETQVTLFFMHSPAWPHSSLTLTEPGDGTEAEPGASLHLYVPTSLHPPLPLRKQGWQMEIPFWDYLTIPQRWVTSGRLRRQ